jgi:hypothetical protein
MILSRGLVSVVGKIQASSFSSLSGNINISRTFKKKHTLRNQVMKPISMNILVHFHLDFQWHLTLGVTRMTMATTVAVSSSISTR